MAKLAFLGTGLIGGGLAEAAARRGDTVRAFNRTADKARALEAFGVVAMPTAAEAVDGVERVHLALSDDAAVDATLEASGPGLARAAVVIDHTTTSPAGTAARARRLADRGIAFLHAPVFMSPQMCRDAKGMMLAAGPRATFEQHATALAAMTGRLDYLGERPDLAAAHKLFGNAMIFAITAGLADVLAIARALDVPAEEAFALFQKFDPSASLAYRGARMARGQFEPSFELAMARKDMRLMLEAADRAPLATLPAIAARTDELLSRGHAHDDLGVLAIDAVPRSA